MYRIKEMNIEGEFQSYVRTLREAKEIFDYLSKMSDYIEVLDEGGKVLYKHQRQFKLFA